MPGDARSFCTVFADDVSGKPSVRGPNSPVHPYATRYHEKHQRNRRDLRHRRQKVCQTRDCGLGHMSVTE